MKNLQSAAFANMWSLKSISEHEWDEIFVIGLGNRRNRRKKGQNVLRCRRGKRLP